MRPGRTAKVVGRGSSSAQQYNSVEGERRGGAIAPEKTVIGCGLFVVIACQLSVRRFMTMIT